MPPTIQGTVGSLGMGSQYYFIISFYEIQKYNLFESSKGYNYSIQGTVGSLGRTLPFILEEGVCRFKFAGRK
jgi:hypothetical protein